MVLDYPLTKFHSFLKLAATTVSLRRLRDSQSLVENILGFLAWKESEAVFFQSLFNFLMPVNKRRSGWMNGLVG